MYTNFVLPYICDTGTHKVKNYNYRRLVKLLKKKDFAEVKLWNPWRLHVKIITTLQLMLYEKGWNFNQNGNQ